MSLYEIRIRDCSNTGVVRVHSRRAGSHAAHPGGEDD
jgi:hypothetical protein